MKKRMNWGILKTGGWEIMMKGALRATAVNARIYGEPNTNQRGLGRLRSWGSRSHDGFPLTIHLLRFFRIAQLLIEACLGEIERSGPSLRRECRPKECPRLLYL